MGSLFTQGGAEAVLSGPREQHLNPDGAAPRGEGRAEKEKAEMDGEQEERADGDGEADAGLDLRGREEDGVRPKKSWNI